MTSEMQVRNVTRRGVQTQSWRIVETGPFACGHTGRVVTDWHVDRQHAAAGDRTGPASAEAVERFGQPCPDCLWVAMGGPEIGAN